MEAQSDWSKDDTARARTWIQTQAHMASEPIFFPFCHAALSNKLLLTPSHPHRQIEEKPPPKEREIGKERCVLLFFN